MGGSALLIGDGSLQSPCSGIRSKIARPGGAQTDLLIQSEKDHRAPGLINLFRIEV